MIRYRPRRRLQAINIGLGGACELRDAPTCIRHSLRHEKDANGNESLEEILSQGQSRGCPVPNGIPEEAPGETKVLARLSEALF